MAIANITVSITEPNVSVSSDASNVTVTNEIANVTVGTAAVASNAQIREAITLYNPYSTPGLGYNNNTGVFSWTTQPSFSIDIAANGMHIANTVQIAYKTLDNEFLGNTIFNEFANVQSNGAFTFNNFNPNFNKGLSVNDYLLGLYGNARIDINSGNIDAENSNINAAYFHGDGSNITGITGITNAQVQAYIESNGLDATANLTTTANISGAYILGDGSQLTNIDQLTNAQAQAYIEANGLDATANLITTANISGAYILGDGSQLTNLSHLTNAQAQAYIETNGLTMTSAITSDSNITTTANTSALHGTFTGATGLTVTGNASIGGNLNVTGNINSETIVDLFIEDRNVTLQYGQVGTPSANSQIFVDRGSSANTYVLWDEGVDAWKFSNDGSTDYLMATSTSDLAEGTNLYYTDARFNTAFGNKTTTDLTEGTNLYYTDASSRAALSVATGSASSGGALSYNSAVGEFTFTPADLSTKIALTDLSVTTTAPSGDGALAYDDTSGIFTFTPADSEASEYGDSNVITLLGTYGNAISSNANISTTGFFEGDLADSGIVTRVYNSTGSTITKGSLVYVTPSTNGGIPIVGLASAANANYMPAVGMVTANISNASSGLVQTSGVIDYAFGLGNEGTVLYVSDTPGEIAYVEAPKGESNVVQSIGHILDSGNVEINVGDPFGRLWFNFDVGGREHISGVPNLNEGNIFLGNNDDQVFPAVLNTSIVPESGSNEYFTTARANTAIDNYTGAFANAQINTTQNITTTGNLNVSTINSAASTDLVLDPNTENVVIKKTLSGVSTTQLTLANEGWAPTAYTSQPVYNGSSPLANTEMVAWVIEGTTTAGSNVITVTTAAEFQDAYGTNVYNGNAPTAGGRTTAFSGGSGALGPNLIGRANGTNTRGAYPFPNGARIQSLDASAFTITMTVPANETATLSWNGGGPDTGVYFFSAGVYGRDEVNPGYAESYFSNYDFKQLGYAGNPAKDELAFAEIAAMDEYGFGQSGPNNNVDIYFSNGLTNTLSQPTYRTRGRVGFEGEKSFIQTNYGMSVGANSTVTNRINNDLFAGFGYTQLWDGTENYATDFGVTAAIPQIGTKQYTGNSAQAGSPFIGTRLQFNSAYGQITDDPQQWYPRTGQELGRIGFWGSHGNLENPSSTAAPAYITVQAADDWTTGSNASMYFVATSDYITTYREPFISYEKGNLILAGGNVAGVTQNITFAPAQRATNNPANVYDFATPGSNIAAFGTINYANTSANSGSEFSVNNGNSLGAGTVGDMQISLHRKDNGYALANTDVVVDEFYTGATVASFGGPNNDLVGVIAGATLGTANLYTFSGITDSNWTFLNGNTYELATIPMFGSQFRQIKQIGGASVTQGGGDAFSGQPAIGQPFAIGSVYRIVSAGTTDFTLIGAADNNVGTIFTATGGGTGTGAGSLILTGDYTFTNVQSSGVTDREWTFELEEQSESLVLKSTNSSTPTTSDILTISSVVDGTTATDYQATFSMPIAGVKSSSGVVSGDSVGFTGSANYHEYTINTSSSGTITWNTAGITGTNRGTTGTNNGGEYYWSIVNSSGASQTIATTGTTPTLSYTLANGAKSLVKLTHIGSNIYAQQEI